MAKRGFKVKRDLLGGGWLSSEMAGQWPFILYIFMLILLYITINLGVANTQKIKGRNERELKNLKADYTSKEAKLQAQSSREQIRARLIKSNSQVKEPVEPAFRVKEFTEQP